MELYILIDNFGRILYTGYTRELCSLHQKQNNIKGKIIKLKELLNEQCSKCKCHE